MIGAVTLRSVTVQSRSAVPETVQVLESLVLIGVVALLIASAGRTKGAGGVALASYQVRFSGQSAANQRVYRELSTAIDDVLRRRTGPGKFPPVAELAADLVEPVTLEWQLVSDGALVNYVGRDARQPGGPTYLMLIQEPPPNAPPHRPEDLDDTHRLVAGAGVMHVGVWFHAAPPPTREALETPQSRGWTEIVLGARRAEAGQ